MNTQIVPLPLGELDYNPYLDSENPGAVYLASLSPNSRRTMRGALNKIAQLCGVPQRLDERGKDITYLVADWGKMKYPYAQAIRSALAEELAPSTVNTYLAALRGVCKQAFLLDKMPAEQYQRLTMIDSVKGETVLAGRSLTHGEINAFLSSCAEDDSPAGVRDACIFALMIAAGLRRAEVSNIDRADIDLLEDKTARLTIRRSKGNKTRQVYLNNGGLDCVLDWLELRGDEEGALIWPINKGAVMRNARMSTTSLYRRIQSRAEIAAIAPFTPHDLRRTYISNLLDAGIDISAVSASVGHANVQTTARYDRRGERALKEAAASVHIPWNKKSL